MDIIVDAGHVLQSLSHEGDPFAPETYGIQPLETGTIEPTPPQFMQEFKP